MAVGDRPLDWDHFKLVRDRESKTPDELQLVGGRNLAGGLLQECR
jgi:hypothetical protein